MTWKADRDRSSLAWEEARRAAGDRSVDTEILRTQKCGLTASGRYWCNTKEQMIFCPHKNELLERAVSPLCSSPGKTNSNRHAGCSVVSQWRVSSQGLTARFRQPRHQPTLPLRSGCRVLLEPRVSGLPSLKLTYLGEAFGLPICHWWLSLQWHHCCSK